MASYRKCANGKWQVTISRKGHKRIYKTFTFKSDAEIWAREQEQALDNNIDVVTKAKDKTTLLELIERYQREVTPTKHGASREHNRLEQWKREDVAKKRVYDVSSSDIAAIRNRLLDAGKASSTINNYLMVLSSVFKTARMEWGYELLDNPIRNVKKPKKEHGRNERLYPNEEALLYDIPDDLIRLVSIFALETSARLKEICKLEKSHVNLQTRTVTVYYDKVGQSKGKIKHLPITKKCEAVIQEAMLINKGTKYLFTGICNTETPEKAAAYISEKWRRKKEKWGIHKEFWFRDLRHEAISRFFEKGLSIMEVMSITGHTNPAQLSTYTHLTHQQSLASKLD